MNFTRKISLLCLTVIFLVADLTAQNTWNPTGLSSGQIRAITVDSSGNLFAARWGSGIFKSGNSGNSWSISGLNGKRVFSMAVSPGGKIFAMAVNTATIEIFCSSDHGSTWLSVFIQSDPIHVSFGGGFEFGPGGKIYAASTITIGPTLGDIGAYLFISTDDGVTWINKDLVGPGPIGGRLASGYTDDILLGTDNKLFAATSDRRLLFTTNDGNEWVSSGIPLDAYLRGLGKDVQGNIYAGLAGENNNLFFSSNNGANWELKGLHLPYYDLIEDICVSKKDNALIVATQSNVFRSTDAGITFDTINQGFPLNTSVLTLCGTPQGTLFAGTLANGVYRFGEPLGIINSGVPAIFELHQNYPNPFNPVTNIRFSIGKDAVVRLTVYDLLGREVKVVLNEFRKAGSYETGFDASSLTSGIYFYRLFAGTFSEVKKMILIK